MFVPGGLAERLMPQNSESLALIASAGTVEAHARFATGLHQVRIGSAAQLELLPEHQYQFVVLAGRGADYRGLEQLYAVAAPQGPPLYRLEGLEGHIEVDPPSAAYRLVVCPPERTPELPDELLTWTSTAYVLWDGWRPADLTPTQQDALVDWLHWGGQLIVSGPRSHESLVDSFLDPWLPAGRRGVRTIETGELAALARYASGTPQERRPVGATKSCVGLDLVLAPEASCPEGLAPGDKPLLAERRVGRGRIVLTAFDLDERQLWRWPGYDGFVNACLLRRPARRFEVHEGERPRVVWADTNQSFDPARATGVRFFSRDAGAVVPPEPYSLSLPSVAAWYDQSPVSQAAAQSLLRSAASPIPGRAFALALLGTYLLVLVPVNALLFRWLGRLELTWAAVPVVALSTTAVIVWLAQLDVGFARVRRDVSIVEFQNEQARAHVTRYLALHVPLGISYQVELDGPSAVALPMAQKSERPSDEPASLATLELLPPGSQTRARLRGLELASNTTGLVHAEQVLPLEGFSISQPIGSGPRITSQFRWQLDGGIVASNEGQARLGPVAPGEVHWLDFQPPQPLAAPAEIAPLTELALQGEPLAPGEVRLVAWSQQAVPGLRIVPDVQTTHAFTLVVAHWWRGPLPEPTPDANRLPSMREEEPRE